MSDSELGGQVLHGPNLNDHEQLRRVWPAVKIILRADSRFCQEALMSWCTVKSGKGQEEILRQKSKPRNVDMTEARRG